MYHLDRTARQFGVRVQPLNRLIVPASDSLLCGVPPCLHAGNLVRAVVIVSADAAAMPVLSMVLRAFPLRPLVRLGRGAFSALSSGDYRCPGFPRPRMIPLGRLVPLADSPRRA